MSEVNVHDLINEVYLRIAANMEVINELMDKNRELLDRAKSLRQCAEID